MSDWTHIYLYVNYDLEIILNNQQTNISHFKMAEEI